MEARDRWIGWDWESRRANLHHVVNMRRFLIRPGVSCNNLASRVLGMSIREFPGDFETRYGHRPLLLESFVDSAIIRGHVTVQPGRAYCGVAEGDWPKGKAYYRFIDKPDDSAVTISAILQPHRERTIQRMKAQKTVLCIQDGSDLNYSALERVSVMDREADPENEFRTSFFEIFDDQRRNSSRVDLLGERRESSCRYTTGRVVFADDN